jgi:carboxyl-terminal processing protease
VPRGPEGLPGPTTPEPTRSLAPAALVVAVLAGVALFLAGLSLGRGPLGGAADERAALEDFVEAYQSITRRYVGQVEPRELIDAATRGMFESLDDPYSSFMSADQFDADLAVVSGEFEGIGARMAAEDDEGRVCAPLGETCALRVVHVLDGSPAERAGLAGGDVVTAIDGDATTGLTIEDAITLIRGPRDTQVGLTIARDGRVIEVSVTRDLIVSQDVRSAVLAEGRVGYLRVDAFTTSAADDFRDQLADLLDAGVDRLVVDVRGDPGGFVEAAVAMASQFIPSGPVLWEEAADGSQRPVEAVAGGLATDLAVRVAVLVDAGSASASESLAGALQDTGRATLVGEATFGKGTIQEWTQLPRDGGGFRLSVARWLTPDRRSVDGVGLEPDVMVAHGADSRTAPGGPDVLRDSQLRVAVETLLGEPLRAPESGAGAGPAGASSVPMAEPPLVPSPSG